METRMKKTAPAKTKNTPNISEGVQLDGRSITPAMIVRVAGGEAVRVASSALKQVTRAHAVLLKAAANGQEIYGLTVGVGKNKDHVVVDAKGTLTPQTIGASRLFNIGLIRSHCAGCGDDLDIATARAVLAARLNMLLAAGSGIQTEVIEAFAGFLNKGITPAIPSGGSVGEADITILAHVGLAMMGEGNVYYKGRKTTATVALQAAGIAPIVPFAKDALSIFSSNAYSAALAALALNDLARLANLAKRVFALSLEALNGNIAPFRAEAMALRPFPAATKAAAHICALLRGSYLWKPDARRPLQDPLSFRTAMHTLGALDESQERLHRLLGIQLNSSDDNPGIAGDAVLPTANFDPLLWVIAFEEAAIVLAHASASSAQRVSRLNDPAFTGLRRFLGAGRTVHAFANAEKPAIALASENRELANPVSLDFFASEGLIEDVATNAPRVVQRVRRQIENSFILLGIELIHAAQAIDLRKQVNPRLRLSGATEALYQALRKQIAMLEVDRPMTGDFAKAAALLKTYPD
jgi:histidine ammonia-lyase